MITTAICPECEGNKTRSRIVSQGGHEEAQEELCDYCEGEGMIKQIFYDSINDLMNAAGKRKCFTYETETTFEFYFDGIFHTYSKNENELVETKNFFALKVL